MGELAKKPSPGRAEGMIDSLRNTESRDLVFFSIWTYGCGGAMAWLVSLIWGVTDSAQAGPGTDPGWRETLQLSATSASQHLVLACIALMLISWLVLTRTDSTKQPWQAVLIRLLARGVYVISMLTIALALSAITFLFIVHG